MNSGIPFPNRDFDAIERIYAAINRFDLAAAAAHFDPDILWIEPPDFPTPGVRHGIVAAVAHIENGRGTWAEGACEIEGIFAGESRIVVYLRAHVRLEGQTEWIDGRFADGWIFRGGKAIEVRNFARREDALAWAGIRPSPG